MELPPGPRHLLRLFPRFAIPSLAAYLTLTLLKGFFPIPLWFFLPVIVLAWPIIVALSVPYNKWSNQRSAMALGAVIPPVVEEWSVLTVKKIAETIKHDYPGDVMYQYSQRYGHTYQLEVLNQPAVITTEPEHMKAMFATQFDSFHKGEILISQMNSLLGLGVFNSDGDLWKFHREMTRPFFTRERISDFDIYQRNSELSMNAISKRMDEGLPLDFQDLVGRFTLDSAAEFLFGNNIGSLSAGIIYLPSHVSMTPQSFYDHPSTTFINQFIEGQVFSIVRMNYNGDWPLFEFWKDRVKPSRKIMDSFIEPFTQQALARRKRELAGKVKVNAEDTTLLEHLVKHTQDPVVLKDELFNLFIAGRDTTASLLTFSLYMLTQHPDCERRLREEIYDKVGPSGSPTYKQMRDMKYMRAFLNEVLRLFPPVPVDFRATKEALTLPPGQPGQKPNYIPANTPTGFIIINMMRRTDLWGPDALDFDPDRFLDERLHKYLMPNRFIFTPFLAGPRICPGQQFAYHEATFFIVRLLQSFTGFTLDDETNTAPPADWASSGGRKPREKICPQAHLTMFVKDGLWVRMKELASP